MELAEPVQIPDFRTKVPENLRRRLTQEELQTWLADQMSLVDQKLDWTMQLLVIQQATVQDHETKLQWWETRVKSPLVLFGVFVAWLIPIVLSFFSK